LKAILKWKFKPKMVGGEAVERQATQEIEFKLAK
jgi:protein TonB